MNYLGKQEKNIIMIIILWVISFAIIQLISVSTSLLNPYYYHYDSAYFQSVGKQWIAGFIPFRDFFDHKGPLIHLISACAYSTSFPRFTLCIIQTSLMSITLYLLFKLFLKYMPFKRAALYILVIIAFASFTFDGGNMTEEYCIPMAVLSLYLEFSWLYDYLRTDKTHTKSHPAHLFFVDGMCCGAILMINMKNAATIVIFDLCIAALMLKDREYVNFIKNIVAAAVGVLCPVIPFLVYFAKKGALLKMIEESVLFVFSYASARTLTVPVVHLIIFSIPEITLLLVGTVLFISGRKVMGAVAIIWSIAIFAIFYTGYKHYFMSGIPLLAMAMILSDIRSFNCRAERILKLGLLSVSLVIVAISVAYLPRIISTYGEKAIRESRNCVMSINDSVSMIPENERENVMVYNMDSFLLSFYIVNDLGVEFDHPYLTEFHMNYDPYLHKYTLDHIKKEEPLWIIMPENSKDPLITGHIKENYTIKRIFPIRINISMCEYNTNLQVWQRKKYFLSEKK